MDWVSLLIPCGLFLATVLVGFVIGRDSRQQEVSSLLNQLEDATSVCARLAIYQNSITSVNDPLHNIAEDAEHVADENLYVLTDWELAGRFQDVCLCVEEGGRND